MSEEWLGLLINRTIPQKNRKSIALTKASTAAQQVYESSRSSASSVAGATQPPAPYLHSTLPTASRMSEKTNSFDLFGGAVTVPSQHPKTTSARAAASTGSTAGSGMMHQGPIVPQQRPTPTHTPTSYCQQPLPLRPPAPAPAKAAAVPKARQAPALAPKAASLASSAWGSATATASTSIRTSSAAHSGTSSSSASSSSSPSLLLSAADFAGADSICRNAAASAAGLKAFLSMCGTAQAVGMSLVWSDLTSNHTSSTKKLCKPSETCNSWYCICGRHTRVDRAFQPLLGACIVLCPPGPMPVNTSAVSEDTMYFIPLAACRSDLTAPVDAAETYVTPLLCEVKLADRWDAVMQLLSMSKVQKVIYNAQLALLPIIHGCELFCPQRCSGAGEVCSVVDPKVSVFLCSKKESFAAEDSDLLKMLAAIQVSLPPQPVNVPHAGARAGEGRLLGRAAYMLWATHAELLGVMAVQRSFVKHMQEMNIMHAFLHTEMPLVRLLALMEYHGVRMDMDELAQVCVCVCAHVM